MTSNNANNPAAGRPTYTTVALDDARPGDEVWQGGEWTPVEAFHVFGSRRDLVKIVFPNGGSLAIPASHCPTIRRAVEAAPVVETLADTILNSRGAEVRAADDVELDRPLGIVGINRHNYPGRCALHIAYDADYCPVCGTTTPVGDRDQVTR